MGWVWIVGAAWVVLAIGAALLIGRSIVLADRKATEEESEADLPNFIVDRPPLRLARPAPEPAGSEPQVVPGSERRDAPTVPGIPAARPPVGRPPVPRSLRQRPYRRSTNG